MIFSGCIFMWTQSELSVTGVYTSGTAEYQSVELQLQSGQLVAPAQNIHFAVLAYKWRKFECWNKKVKKIKKNHKKNHNKKSGVRLCQAQYQLSLVCYGLDEQDEELNCIKW